MTYRAQATNSRPRQILVVGLLLVTATVAPALAYRSLASSAARTVRDPGSGAPDATTAPRSDAAGGAGGSGGVGPDDRGVPRPAPRGALGEADGVVPDGTTAFDSQVPAVARLRPTLLQALRAATTDASGSGVRILVDSGWRSTAYQEQLLEQAISKYGSAREAARWVATPATSAHVAGDAVDIGPAAATTWLAEHGTTYGLCQIYSNEPWHFELRPDTVARGCPPMYADPTHDPRMRD